METINNIQITLSDWISPTYVFRKYIDNIEIYNEGPVITYDNYDNLIKKKKVGFWKFSNNNMKKLLDTGQLKIKNIKYICQILNN